MYVHRIEFCSDVPQSMETRVDFIYRYLGNLRMNGQICGGEWPIYEQVGGCVTTVLAPTHDALHAKYHSEYGKRTLQEGIAQGIAITASLLGADCASAGTCTCDDSSGYVLFTTYSSLASPIRCFDCFSLVPLYQLPVMPSGECYEYIVWQSDYQSCDALQMNCQVLEKATTRQLSDPNSPLATAGREICRKLATLSGKPCYYYLYRAHGRSVVAEKKRACPVCGQTWFMPNKLHDLFHYQCEQCGLLSNFAWNLSP